jgi:hypothetical protein
MNHKSVLVAADVEDDAIFVAKARMRAFALDVFRAVPSGL